MAFDYQPLKVCFRSDVMAAQSIGLYQACGFTLAVAGAPEVVSPLEWLPCLFPGDRLPDFSDNAAREKTLELLVRLKDHWAALIAQRAVEDALLDLPQGVISSAAGGPHKPPGTFAKAI